MGCGGHVGLCSGCDGIINTWLSLAILLGTYLGRWFLSLLLILGSLGFMNYTAFGINTRRYG